MVSTNNCHDSTGAVAQILRFRQTYQQSCFLRTVAHTVDAGNEFLFARFYPGEELHLVHALFGRGDLEERWRMLIWPPVSKQLVDEHT